MSRTGEKQDGQADSGGLNGFYRDLKALYENAFPKVCASCGRRYENMADFLSDTDQTHGSTGLMDVRGMSECAQVMLFRNCRCGSTLMIECHDRRSNTPEGRAARAAFGRLLERLKKIGVPAHEAREELHRHMRGEPSQKLDSWLKKLNG